MTDLLNNTNENSNEHADSYHEIRITIAKPQDEVFEYTLEPNNTPKWCSAIEHESVDTKQIGVGTKYTNNFGELEVTDYEKNVYFELSETDTEYQCSYSFRKVDENTTEIIYFEQMLDGSTLVSPMKEKSFKKLQEILEK